MTNYHDFSDLELVSLLKVDDHIAFNELFKRYRALLFSVTLRRLNDTELAKDLIHDTFADLWDKRLVIQVPGEFQSFLFTVIKNRILNHYKRQKVSQRYLDHFHSYLSTAENATDYLVRHNDLAALIEKEVAALPEKMRQVFELSRDTAMTRKEIADLLNIPEETVKSRMRHALILLKDRLGILVVFVFL